MNIGEKLMRSRLENRLSRKELAKRAGCGPEMIRLIEIDKRDPSLKLLKAIVDVLVEEECWYENEENRAQQRG